MIKILYLLTNPISIGPLGTDYRVHDYYHCILYVACYHILLGYQCLIAVICWHGQVVFKIQCGLSLSFFMAPFPMLHKMPILFLQKETQM